MAHCPYMKNFINLSDLNKNFKNLSVEKLENSLNEINKQQTNSEQVSDILRKLYADKNVTINNNAEFDSELQSDCSEDEKEEDIYFINDNTINVDARKNLYEYPEDYLKKYEMKSKSRKNQKPCSNWEEMDVKSVANKPKLLNFKRYVRINHKKWAFIFKKHF
ncbi:hypothetical protein NBO_333g0001 [Nosema bombycis CQ1]|uniref:Uncharacterized protein n=1 Tax=Nosema bombycis (strain CQ1 / CVCC 102059) TaxID=578461 RepID=R0MFK9_NOSB1|nr:hypothetical protein NBO_333g0001 [Nosema bombycis CQ1]|eukprot:EOB12895.1 hypothetical protein NBO_333g0001 [Nosema bombycis CQ1]